MLIRITVRNFTGASFALDVDPATTVAELKQQITAAGKGKSTRPPVLSFKGHELREDRQLHHYDIVAKNTIHILPPSNAEKVNLRFETDDGAQFKLLVDPDITIAQLKREIFAEEKITARQLKALLFPREPDHPDDNETLLLEELNDDARVSSLSLKSQIIAINTTDRREVTAGKRPARAAEFLIVLSIDERQRDGKPRKFKVSVRDDQTLPEFEEGVMSRHSVNLSNYALILMGRDLKDDNAFLSNLGFVPGCTIHAVADVHICVTTSGRDFDMALSPMTRVSTIRQTLEGIDSEIPWHKFWFSLDGKESLTETSTMWDLNIFSNTMILLKNRYLSLNVHLRGGPEDTRLGPTYYIEAEEEELVEGLKQRIYLESGILPSGQLLLLRDNVLQEHLTLKQENLRRQEDIDVINLDSLPEGFPSE